MARRRRSSASIVSFAARTSSFATRRWMRASVRISKVAIFAISRSPRITVIALSSRASSAWRRRRLRGPDIPSLLAEVAARNATPGFERGAEETKGDVRR